LLAVGGLEDETATGLVFDVKGKFDFFVFQWQLQAREFGGDGGTDLSLDLLLQLLARGCFERGHAGISGMGDEPTFGLGLDSVGEVRD